MGFTRFEASSVSAKARLQPSLYHVPGAMMCTHLPCPSSLLGQLQPHAGQRMLWQNHDHRKSLSCSCCAGETEREAHLYYLKSLPGKPQLLANQSKSHTVPSDAGTGSALDFRALYSTDNSALSHSLPCMHCAHLKHRGGSPAPARSWQWPTADGSRDSPTKPSETLEETPALSGQTWISSQREVWTSPPGHG